MDYIIRSFDEKNGQITVEYAGKWTYAIDLTVENGAFPIGEKLEEVIQGMAPTWLVERQQSLETTPLNSDVIRALVQPLPEVTIEVGGIQDQRNSQQEQLESDTAFLTQLITDILASKGL